jgi:hypothetical protein
VDARDGDRRILTHKLHCIDFGLVNALSVDLGHEITMANDFAAKQLEYHSACLCQLDDQGTDTKRLGKASIPLGSTKVSTPPPVSPASAERLRLTASKQASDLAGWGEVCGWGPSGADPGSSGETICTSIKIRTKSEEEKEVLEKGERGNL